MGRTLGLALALVIGCADDPKGRGQSDDVEGGTVGDDDSEGTNGVEDIMLVLGIGAEEFAPVEAGDSVTLIHGPQGGWHLEAAGLVQQSAPEVSVQPRVIVPELDDLELVGQQGPTFVALVGYDPAVREGVFYNVRGLLDSDQELVCSLAGLTLRYEITVAEFTTDRTATASIDVVAALDPADEPLCGD
jgi:hypothetical protein